MVSKVRCLAPTSSQRRDRCSCPSLPLVGFAKLLRRDGVRVRTFQAQPVGGTSADFFLALGAILYFAVSVPSCVMMPARMGTRRDCAGVLFLARAKMKLNLLAGLTGSWLPVSAVFTDVPDREDAFRVADADWEMGFGTDPAPVHPTYTFTSQASARQVVGRRYDGRRWSSTVPDAGFRPSTRNDM